MVEAAAHTLAAILVVGSGEIVLNPYVEISSCAVASAINENNWRHSPVAAAAALSIVPLLAEAMTPRACLGCTALRNSLGTLLKSHVDGCCQASVRICLALVSSSEARLEVVHAGLVPMMLSVLDRRSEDSTR